MRVFIAILFCATCVSSAIGFESTAQIVLAGFLGITKRNLEISMLSKKNVKTYIDTYFNNGTNLIDRVQIFNEVLVLLSIDISDPDGNVIPWVIYNKYNTDNPSQLADKNGFTFSLQQANQATVESEDIKSKLTHFVLGKFLYDYYGENMDDESPLKSLMQDHENGVFKFDDVAVESCIVYERLPSSHDDTRIHVFVGIALNVAPR